MGWLEDFARIAPVVDGDGVPHCTRESCPVYEPKARHCRVLGGQPEEVCEPAVAAPPFTPTSVGYR